MCMYRWLLLLLESGLGYTLPTRATALERMVPKLWQVVVPHVPGVVTSWEWLGNPGRIAVVPEETL